MKQRRTNLVQAAVIAVNLLVSVAALLYDNYQAAIYCQLFAHFTNHLDR